MKTKMTAQFHCLKTSSLIFGIALVFRLASGQCVAPPPGLILWWDFSSGNSTDISGFQNHGTVHGSPVFISSTVQFSNPSGNQPASQWIAVPYSASIRALETNSFTVAIRYKCSDTAEQNGRLFGNTTNLLMDYNAGGITCAYSQFRTSGGYYTVPTNYAGCIDTSQTTDGADHWQVFCLDRTTGNATQYIDATNAGSVHIPSFSSGNMSGLVLGATMLNDNYGARLTTVEDLCIFSRALTSNEVASISAAGPASLCQKPFVITPPSSQSSFWGRSASFSILAGGQITLAYQWFKDVAPISGATNTSLILTNLQGSDATAYTVVITNLYGGVTSSPPANLTVNAADISIGLYPGPGITINGLVGYTYGIQSSTALNPSSWIGQTNLTLTVPTEIWYDPVPALLSQRFYRVVQGPIPIP